MKIVKTVCFSELRNANGTNCIRESVAQSRTWLHLVYNTLLRLYASLKPSHRPHSVKSNDEKKFFGKVTIFPPYGESVGQLMCANR